MDQMPENWREWVSMIGSLASMAALAISILIWQRVRDIEKRVVSRLSLPKFVKQLKRNATNLSDFGLDPTGGGIEIRAELALCRSNLRHTSKHAGPIDSKTAKKLRWRIYIYNHYPVFIPYSPLKPTLESLYTDLIALIQDIENSEMEQKIGRQYVYD